MATTTFSSHYPVKQQGVTELLFSTVSSAPDYDYDYRNVDDGESLAHCEVVVGSGSSVATTIFSSHYPVKQQGVTELLFSTVSSAPDYDYDYRNVDDG